jgi:CHAD domain-containing protein
VSRPVIRFGDRIKPLLLERVGVLDKNLPKALAGEEEPVHQVRVSGRRLRAVLPLLTHKPDGKRVRRAIRILREMVSGAGGSRDLDVFVGLFEERVSKRGSRRPEEADLLRRLRAARARSRARLAGNLLDLEISGLRRDLREILARGGEEIFTVRERLSQEREAAGADLIGQVEALGHGFDPIELHRLRRGVRRARYVFEIGASIGEDPGETPKKLKGLQEELGLIHDAHGLAAWFGRQAAAASKIGRAALAAEATKWEAAFESSARARHREYLKGDPGAAIRTALRVEESRDSVAG